jgi:putative flavoprotein involved in K+ transport
MSVVKTIIIGGGQSGLAAARACLELGQTPVVLEAGADATGSWPRYYDSLTLFSPARYSALPGMPFRGDLDRYPHRDEVVAYLARYAASLDVDIRTHTRVVAVSSLDGGFAVDAADGTRFTAASVIAASGSFSSPHLPTLPGQEGFAGTLLHSAGYANPEPYAGQRVVVVGAGNSAVQIAYELAKVASVTLATNKPVRWFPQRPLGRDIHFWFQITGFDRLPRQVDAPPTQPVLDTGIYRGALADGLMGRRPMFRRFDGEHLVWSDGSRERVDAVLFATGFRPSLDYLHPLGALDERGRPRHTHGLSTTHKGLGFLGLEWQRSPASNSLRGVGRDARYLVRKLASQSMRRP